MRKQMVKRSYSHSWSTPPPPCTPSMILPFCYLCNQSQKVDSGKALKPVLLQDYKGLGNFRTWADTKAHFKVFETLLAPPLQPTAEQIQ